MLADIYMGKISMWNDNRLQLANPGVELPRARTTPVGRYEQSADSSDFTTILSAFSSEWNKTYGVFDSPNFKNGICCNSSSWPSAVWLYGSRAAGMIGVVSSIPYTVGFANAVSLVSNNMTVASLANELGNYLYPSVKSAQKAIEYWVERKSIDRSDISNAIDSDAYPIVSYMELSFIGLGHNLSMDCCTARELVGFVELVLSDYGQSLASNKYLMVPLIEQVKLKVRQVLQTLTCREQNVSQAYFESIALNQGANIISSHALIIGIVVALVVLILLFLFLLYDQRKRKLRLRINAIKIHSGNLKPLKDSKSLASRSTLTLKSDYSSFQHFSDSYMFMLNDSQVMGQIITDINFHSLKLPSLLQLSIFREEVLHENLLPFLGITSFNAAECLLISQFDCRLKLHDFLSMEKYEMTDDIRYNLIQDVIQGMKFLHNRQMAHLLLSSHTCYLDRSWRVKIGQWEINKFLSVENLTSFENITKFKEQMLDNNSLIRLLYLDPMAMSDRTFAHYSDVFSFSYLLFEIFTKQLPFDLEVELHGTTFEDLLKKKYFMMEDLTLEVPEQVPEPIRNLIKDCQNSQREKRPTFQQIEDQMIIKKCRAKKEVIELLIDAVETYLAGLEDTVATRTAAVKDMNVRLTAILSEVLPTEISTRLLKGEEVHPESFDCVTVLFVGKLSEMLLAQY